MVEERPSSFLDWRESDGRISGKCIEILKGVVYFFLFDTKTLATHRADTDTRVMLKYVSREARFTTQF